MTIRTIKAEVLPLTVAVVFITRVFNARAFITVALALSGVVAAPPSAAATPAPSAPSNLRITVAPAQSTATIAQPTATATRPTGTPTATRTSTPSVKPSSTPTPAASLTATRTATSSPTPGTSATATRTALPTSTPTRVATPTVTVTRTSTSTPTFTPTPGTGAVSRLPSYEFTDDGKIFSNAVIIDATKTFAYIGTTTSIVKFSLADMRRGGSLPVDAAGLGPVAAAYDSSAGLGYFLFNGVAARIMVVKLPELTVVRTIPLTDGTALQVGSLLLDPQRGKAYVGTRGVLKVDLLSGAVESSITVSTDLFKMASFNADRTFAFFGGNAGLYKVQLDPFVVAAQTTLASGETNLLFGGFDAGTGNIVVGTNNKLVRFAGADLRRIDAFTIATASVGYLQSGVLDGGTLYIGTDYGGTPGHLLKYRVSDLAQTGFAEFDSGGTGFTALGVRSGTILAATASFPGKVYRVDAATLASQGLGATELGVFSLIGVAPLPGGKVALLNRADTLAHKPASLIVVNTVTQMVEKVLLLPAEATPWVLIADPDGSALYLGETSVPARLSKYRTSDLTLVATQTFADVFFVSAGGQDPASRDLFLLPGQSSRKILRVRSSDLALVSTLELPAEDGVPYAITGVPDGSALSPRPPSRRRWPSRRQAAPPRRRRR